MPLVRTEVLVFIGSLGIWASFLFSKRPIWSRKYLKRGAFVSLPSWTPQFSVCCSRIMTHIHNVSHLIGKHHPSASSWGFQVQAQSHLLQEGFLNGPGSTSGCHGVIHSDTYHPLCSILCLSQTGFPIFVGSSCGVDRSHASSLPWQLCYSKWGSGTRHLFAPEPPPSPQISWIRICLTTRPLPHLYYRWSVVHWTLGSTMLGHLFPVTRNKTIDSEQPWNHYSVDFNPNCILNHLRSLKIMLAYVQF